MSIGFIYEHNLYPACDHDRYSDSIVLSSHLCNGYLECTIVVAEKINLMVAPQPLYYLSHFWKFNIHQTLLVCKYLKTLYSFRPTIVKPLLTENITNRFYLQTLSFHALLSASFSGYWISYSCNFFKIPKTKKLLSTDYCYCYCTNINKTTSKAFHSKCITIEYTWTIDISVCDHDSVSIVHFQSKVLNPLHARLFWIILWGRSPIHINDPLYPTQDYNSLIQSDNIALQLN